MRKITKVICISRAPQADLQREGFKNALDLDSTPFILESDTKGDLVPIFGKVCDAIDKNLREDEGVLVWDVGGGVAVLAAYSEYSIMMALTASTGQLTNKYYASHEKVRRLLARGHGCHYAHETGVAKTKTPSTPKNHRPAA